MRSRLSCKLQGKNSDPELGRKDSSMHGQGGPRQIAPPEAGRRGYRLASGSDLSLPRWRTGSSLALTKCPASRAQCLKLASGVVI